MKRTLLFMLGVIMLVGCERNNPIGEKEPIALDYKLEKEYMLIKNSVNIDLLAQGVKTKQSQVWVEFDESLKLELNSWSMKNNDYSTYNFGEKNNLVVTASKVGKFAIKIRLAGETQVLEIPIDVRARQYEIEDISNITDYQATYRYPTKYKIVDRADSTDAYTKRKYEVSVYTRTKSTIFVDQTRIWCDTTVDFMAANAKDRAYQFEGEFTPWGAGEVELFYRVMDDEGVIVDCPVKYNVKPTEINCKIDNLNGYLKFTEKGAIMKVTLTPPKGTQSAYFIALEGVYKDEMYMLDDNGGKMTGGTKKQIVEFKQHTGETLEADVYFQVEKVFAEQIYRGKLVVYSTGGEKWEFEYTPTYPRLESKITFTHGDIVDFADNNVVNVHYEFDPKTKPNANSKLKLKLESANAPVKLPNGKFIEIGQTVDATELFTINADNTQVWSMPVNIYPVKPKKGNVNFTFSITDEFGAFVTARFSVGTKEDKLMLEATGNFTSTYPEPIEFKIAAKFERSGQTDKLKKMKVNFWPSSGQKGYFIINGVEVKHQDVDIEIQNTGAQFDVKYVPTEEGEHYSELRFFTQDGREGRCYISSKHN